jgi:hypothetical protein
MSSQNLTLDVLITEDRRVLIQVMVPAIDGMKREAVWTATFTDPHTSDEEEESRPAAWTPEGEDQMEQIGKVIGRVIDMRQKRDFNQLSMLLHLALHNLLDAAKGVLKEVE